MGKTKCKLFTLFNKHGMLSKLTNYGTILVSLVVPDKNGHLDDVVLGFDSIEKYSTNDICYFGATVGRNSNRVKNAKFSLNGITYNLDSGFNPYNERIWNYTINEENNAVSFNLS